MKLPTGLERNRRFTTQAGQPGLLIAARALELALEALVD